MSRLLALVLGQRAQHAEFVVLRVGHHHPRGVSLPDVDASSAETFQSLELSLLVVRTTTEVNSVLAGLLALGRRQAQPSAGSIRRYKQMFPRGSGPHTCSRSSALHQNGVIALRWTQSINKQSIASGRTARLPRNDQPSFHSRSGGSTRAHRGAPCALRRRTTPTSGCCCFSAFMTSYFLRKKSVD